MNIDYKCSKVLHKFDINMVYTLLRKPDVHISVFDIFGCESTFPVLIIGLWLNVMRKLHINTWSPMST